MEIRIEDKEKCELFFKLFPTLFDSTLGSFDSYVLRINRDGLSINQKDISTTTQLDVRYPKNAFDHISDDEVYVKFKGNHIKKIFDAAKQIKSDEDGLTLKYTSLRNPFLQVFNTQKFEIWLEPLTEEDKVSAVLPYTVETYASILDLKLCSKLISTLDIILDTNNKDTASVEFELRKGLLIIHAMDDDRIKRAQYKIESTTNTETIQKVVGYYHHLMYVKRLIDAGAEGLRIYIQTDNNLIFEVKFPFDINITIYAARFNID